MGGEIQDDAGYFVLMYSIMNERSGISAICEAPQKSKMATIWAITQYSCPKKQMHNNPTTSAALQPTSETACFPYHCFDHALLLGPLFLSTISSLMVGHGQGLYSITNSPWEKKALMAGGILPYSALWSVGKVMPYPRMREDLINDVIVMHFSNRLRKYNTPPGANNIGD
ncbi:Uncharacterized protein Fot_56409 [Forsythia ovata]|uniref:Uncharacterized protein n=1 Tax=Forsythia ovata TaxID=205694 RepID=A0ABD1P030_9LAMI